MSEDGGDKEQKTEDPTQRRLEDARKRGQVVASKEVTNFLMLVTLALLLAGYSPTMLKQARRVLLPFIEHAGDLAVDPGALRLIFMRILGDGLLLLMVPFLATMVVAVASGLLQHGFNISAEPIMPKLSKISPMAGIGRMFSMRSVMELVKGIIKLTIIGIVAYLSLHTQLMHLRQLPDSDTLALLLFLGKLVARLMIGVCVAMFFIATLDYLYQRFEFMKSLRMSKQELKDEYKQQEGDPQIKQKLRQIRAERAQKRMMAEVPKADVIITNPTHYAVALKYDLASMQAPLVVAKGADHVALNIRKLATEHDIPIVENPPLARALYDTVDIDDEIPVQHYQAVAQVISYVFKLKGKVPK